MVGNAHSLSDRISIFKEITGQGRTQHNDGGTVVHLFLGKKATIFNRQIAHDGINGGGANYLLRAIQIAINECCTAGVLWRNHGQFWVECLIGQRLGIAHCQRGGCTVATCSATTAASATAGANG